MDRIAISDSGNSTRVSLEALYSISSAINASLDLDAVLAHALDKILAVLGFSSGVVRLLEPSTGELRLAAAAGLARELAGELSAPFRVGEGALGLAIQRRALLVEDLSRGPLAGSPWARHGYRTFISIPLQCREMLLGCMNLFTPDRRSLDATERELLTTLANQVGMAVANAELYTAAQRKIEYLSALHRCSQDMVPTPDLQRVLQLTSERMAQLLHLDRAIVLDWCPETQELVAVAGCGIEEPLLSDLRVPLETLPLAAAVLRDRHVTLSADPAGDGLLPAPFVRAAQMRTALVAPLVTHDEAIGLLVADRRDQPLVLSADEMELATIFANQASVWIANARLFVRELSARARAEAAETHFRELLESAPDGIVIVDTDGRIVLANTQAEAMFGYSREELLGQLIEILLPERYRASHVGHRTRYASAPRTRPMGAGLDLAGRHQDGREFPVEISLSPLQTDAGVLITSVIRDITERKRTEAERDQLLALERERSEQLKLSVREAHHRIKNNLQAISDLLYLEMTAGNSSSPEDVLRGSMERIQAIATVHDLLSQDEDVRVVDARAVLERLVPMVLRSSGVTEGAVTVRAEIAPVPLSSKRATALALIANELVSNAAKHAFKGNGQGELTLSLQQESEELVLRVRDNGPGLPVEFSTDTHSHVGLDVVRTLAERDLNGCFSLTSDRGVLAEVRFVW
jgi:PAS domain S-box-containing protein